jgi:hypothetical protein
LSDLLRDLYEHRLRIVMVSEKGDQSRKLPIDPVVLAGSFNPLHEGHRQLLEVAEQVTSRRGIFEISIENVDKPDLPRGELERRLQQLAGLRDVAVTRARLFSDKAHLLPGAWFVIGFDTAQRLIDDQYYADDGMPRPAERALKGMLKQGARFVVAGRAGDDGRFRGFEDMDVPESLRELFIPVPQAMFRVDLSSTELRRLRGRR